MKSVFKMFLSLVLTVCFFLSLVYLHINATENKVLDNKIIYIDAGHGGKDNGASVDGVLEDSINLSIGGFLLEELIDDGAYVLMSRTNDYDLASMYQTNRKREDLKKRVKYINDGKVDLFVSVHLNTYSSSNVNGGQVFYKKDDHSKILADMIQLEMNNLSGKNKNTKNGDFYILNNTIPTGVLIECGFLSNERERKLLNTSDYQRKVAKAIKKGIVNYFNYKKV